MRAAWKTWGTNLLLLLAAITGTMGAFEAGLRLFLPQKLYRFPPGLVRSDPDLVFSLNPGFRGELRNPEYATHVSINSLGLRGPEPPPRRPGGIRIVGLGDSFVSAFNMEEPDTFLSVAERALRRLAGEDGIEVINAGTPNYGTWHELRLLRRLGPVLGPDAVVLCAYVGNDVENNLSPREAVVQNGVLMNRRPVPGVLPLPLREWLQRHSMAYVFLWNAWNQIRPVLGWTGSDPIKEPKDLASRRSVPYIEDGYRVTQEILRQFRDETRSLGLPVLLVLIPAEYQVYDRQFDDWIGKQGLDPADYDVSLPTRRWIEMAERLDLPVADLLPVFRSHASGPYLYMSLDGHLTREGNRLAGETIAESLLPIVKRRTSEEKRS